MVCLSKAMAASFDAVLVPIITTDSAIFHREAIDRESTKYTQVFKITKRHSSQRNKMQCC